jgi:hypothetical protein
VRLGTLAHADNADEGRAPQAVVDAATAAGLTDLAALLGDEGFGVRAAAVQIVSPLCPIVLWICPM